MRIKNNLFPYPVLNSKETMSSYKYEKFYFDYNENQDEDYYYLNNISVCISNENIVKLIENKKAGIRIIIECSKTLYRKIFEIELEGSKIKIPLDYIRGPVEISCFVIALENIKEFYSTEFLDIYNGYKFNIDKYDLLAVDDGYNVKIDYEESEDNKVSSIFLVICSHDDDSKTIVVEPTNKKIKIILPQEQYNIYNTMKDESSYQNVFFSILAIPALNYSLFKIQEDDLETALMKYDWLNSVKNAYTKVYDKEIEEDWQKLEYDTAQRLLNDGYTKAITDFQNLVFVTSTVGGDDDE